MWFWHMHTQWIDLHNRGIELVVGLSIEVREVRASLQQSSLYNPQSQPEVIAPFRCHLQG